MRFRVYIETLSDANRLSGIAGTFDETTSIRLIDNSGFCVNAKSILGAICSMEFDEIWLVSNKDVYSKFAEFA
jgi:hypothetical protein